MKKYSKDNRVVFDSEYHTYTLDNEVKLKSVTKIISKFKNFFDSDFFAEKVAKRDKKTKEQVLLEWKKKADKSCEVGTLVHSIIEDYILTGNIETYGIDNRELVAVEFIESIFKTNRLIPIETEYIVYNDKIAGQIDLICKDNEGNHYIIDFKTNSEITKYSYYKKMIFPLDGFNDSNFYHYSLQLCIYKELLKEYNIKDLFIVHIKDDGYEFIKCDNILENLNVKQLF